MIAAHAIISGLIDEPMHMHRCICMGGVCIPNELGDYRSSAVSGVRYLEYLLLVLLARDARHDALARPPAAVAVV